MGLCLTRWLCLRRLFLIASLAAVSAAGLPALSQTAPPSQNQPVPSSWDDWFYGQRRYGLGYIPEGALGKAIAQRDAMGQQTPYRPQAAASAPPSASQWISLGPSVMNS